MIRVITQNLTPLGHRLLIVPSSLKSKAGWPEFICGNAENGIPCQIAKSLKSSFHHFVVTEEISHLSLSFCSKRRCDNFYLQGKQLKMGSVTHSLYCVHNFFFFLNLLCCQALKKSSLSFLGYPGTMKWGCWEDFWPSLTPVLPSDSDDGQLIPHCLNSGTT